MDGWSIDNDAPYDGCKINPKSGKTIKFERQKEPKLKEENKMGSNTHTN
jgi:hypothetical protein